MKILNHLLLTILVVTSFNSLGQNKRNGYVPVNDSLRLYFEFYGHGKDTVLIPDVQWISQYLKDYNGKLSLLVFDVRDRGKSSSLKSNDKISIEDNLEDVEAIRRHFRIRKVNLLGWSYMGAMVAMYASNYPNNIKSIILMSPMSISKNIKSVTKTTDFSMYEDELNAFIAKGGKESDPVAFSRLFWRNKLAPSIHDLSKLDKYVKKIPNIDNETPGNALSNVGAISTKLGDWDFADMASRIQCRALIIFGTSDTIPVESSLEWATSILDSRYLEFSKSGHFLFAEETKKWISTIETFFNGDWPDKSVEPRR